MSLAEKFDSGLPAWKEWQDQPWGRLRYAIAQANLLRHLPARPLHILDVGGGNGRDSLPLAAQGHSVTIIDFSAEMLAEAHRSSEALGVAALVTAMQADLAELPRLFDAPVFDVVLCHNVLQYVDDLAAALAAICQPLRSGGVISVMSVNRYSEPYRLAVQQNDPVAAYTQLGALSTVVPMFDTPVRRYIAEDVIAPLQASGCEMIGRYGIRCVQDYVRDDWKADPDTFAALERLEYEMSDMFPYYLLARFFQVIAQKAVA